MSASGPPSDGSPAVERRPSAPGVASGKTPKTRSVVGRDAELQRIEQVLEVAAGGHCSALVLVGEPGVGKTTLLETARQRAADFTPLSARGAEPESQLAHAGLLELLSPLRGLLDQIPESQGAALRSALGWGSSVATADRSEE